MVRQKNNNPFNLRASSKYTWQGQIGVDYQGFVMFDTLENGVRAGIRNLHTGYFSKGLNIRQLVSKYAPSNENDTENYIRFVAKPFKSDLVVPVTKDQKATVIKQILLMEGEKYPVTEEMINKNIA